jgi:hypothetical protein
VAILAEAIALDPTDPRRRSIGRLDFLGGVILHCRDPRFGGWSDLALDPASDRVVMISDRGHFLEARLESDAGGAPLGLAEARLGALIDPAGRRVIGRRADAEGLAALADGGFAVSFEQAHRIWRYPSATPSFARPPVELPPIADLAETATLNGGIEAIAQLRDGSLLALGEQVGAAGLHPAWIGGEAGWRRTAYRAAPGHDPTGACLLPGGDLLVLERRFELLSLAARIARVPAARIGGGEPLVGEPIGRLASPLTVDNFEGIAARRAPDGATRVYLVSDDNFLFFQRTLLFAFALAG